MPKGNKKNKHHSNHHSNTQKLGHIIISNFQGTISQLQQFLIKHETQLKKVKIDQFDENFKIVIYKEYIKESLLRLNGRNYSGSNISVEFFAKGEETVSFKSVCQLVINKYYDGQKNEINFDNIQSKMEEFNYNKVCDANSMEKIFLELSFLKPNTQTIHYCGNNATSLSCFRNVSKNLPSVENLDLRNNSIGQITQLDHLKEIPLKILCLNGNPITAQPGYEFKVRTLFKNLEILDQQPLNSHFQFPVHVVTDIPPIKIGYFPDYDMFKVIYEFLNRFFSAFENKDADIQFYSNSSIFTMTLGKQSSSQFALSDRNHILTTSQNDYENKTYIGPKIINFFKNKMMPAKYEMSEIAFDIYPVPAFGNNCCTVNVMGLMSMANKTFNFFRTMILCFENGNVFIVNDHLHLFRYENQMFGIIKPTRDAIDATETLIKMFGLSQQVALKFLQLSNFDLESSVNYINMVQTMMNPPYQFSFDEAVEIGVFFMWNTKHIQQSFESEGKNLINAVRQVKRGMQ